MAAEVGGQHGERAGDGEQVGGDGRSCLGDLGRLVAAGAIDRARLVVHAVHAAEVDQLERAVGLDDVVRLEVTEHQPQVVEVAERRQDLHAVGDRLLDGERVGMAVVGGPSRLQHRRAG